MIVKKGNQYVVKSENGKKVLSAPMSKEHAKERLAQIEYFKSRSKK